MLRNLVSMSPEADWHGRRVLAAVGGQLFKGLTIVARGWQHGFFGIQLSLLL